MGSRSFSTARSATANAAGRARALAAATASIIRARKGVRKRGWEEQLPVAEQPVAAAPTTCFKVKEVLGMSVCLQLDPDERRVGRHADDDDYQLQVRGGFGKHEGEDDTDLIPDTRWVSLAELVTNDVDAAALAALETLAKKLPKALKAAAKRIRQRVHEREE